MRRLRWTLNPECTQPRSMSARAGGRSHLFTRNVQKKRVATFALSRFRRIEATGQNFARPDAFSPETYARQAFGIVGGEKLIKVRLPFEPKLAVYITERDWHPSQEFRTRRDCHVEMRMETTGRKELIRWVLSCMPDVKVLAPTSLRDRIREKLRDGLDAQQ
jgi:predicted DNA-binding transcriptional regulator YafY